MKIKPIRRHAFILEMDSPSGYKFLIEEEPRPGSNEPQLRVTVTGERIMYGTEQGNNNADYVLLIK